MISELIAPRVSLKNLICKLLVGVALMSITLMSAPWGYAQTKVRPNRPLLQPRIKLDKRNATRRVRTLGKAALAKAQAKTQTTTQDANQEVITLGAARRVFSVDLDRDGSDELLIAHQAQLTAHRWDGARWSELWSIKGPGVTQQVTMNPRSPKLWVAWGKGLGMMNAPITVSALDPLNGVGREVWRYQGARSQVVHLELIEIDSDPEPELFIAHFVNKYHTRRVILDQLTQAKPLEHATTSIRMGTSWLIGEIDGESGLEEVIGRVYGDAKGEYGDLSTQPFTLKRSRLTLGQVVPSERGVKFMAIARPELGGGVLFSDGWVAAYGKKARASLKRLRWVNGRAVVERLADSPNEFTFFRFWQRAIERSALPLSAQDHKESGVKSASKRAWVIFAQGNKGVSLITPTQRGSWRVTLLHKTPPIVNAAVGYAGGRWWVFTPHPTGARAQTITLPSE